ncbi:Cysteine-rich venom protein [Salix suchowensis]|nr:Cysteine-rich venom protein [Salix suchowensis]
MQRLSLGSPVTKLHPHGGADTLLCKNDTKPSSTSLSPDADDLDHKSTKRRRFSSSLSVLSPAPPKPEKLIHLIPFLILFCFLVLFLLSHTPSQSDLARFNGFYNHIEAASESIDALSEVRRGDVLAIRSFRNLQGIAADELTSFKYRFHRKFAHF